MLSQCQLLSKIIATKDYSIISANNLTEEYFFDYKSEFNYIKNHYDLYKTVPDKITFISTFPEFTFLDVEEPNSFLLEELFKDYNQSYLVTRFNRLRELLKDNKTDDAMQYFINSVDKLHTNTALSWVDVLKDTGRYDRYIEKTQDRSEYYCSTGLAELDTILGGIDRQNENMVITARPGVGKCLEKGTEILMANGTIKKVEDIQVGDQVQSYNRINTVLALHQGVSNGYKIIPSKGKPFTVSSNHILTLEKIVEKYDKSHRRIINTDERQLVDIMVEDYLKLSTHKKHLLKLIRPAVEYTEKLQTIDPYILGIWLGDGNSAGAQFCTADQEIVDALQDYANKHNIQFKYLPSGDKKDGKAHVYSLTKTTADSFCFCAELKALNLYKNKHIPLNYLTGNREQRLQLLAGLLDTDGCYMNYIKKNKQTSLFDFTQKNKILFDQVCQLARGLGFKVCCCKPKYLHETYYYRMSISGPLHLIPTKVARKKAKKSNSHISPIRFSFKVEPVDRVEYYGFMCDGDQRYLLADNTLTHNTYILTWMAAAAAKQGLNVGLYSGEMSVDKMGYRLDTILGHLKNSAMNRGDLYIQREYKNYMESICNGKHGTLKVITPNDIPGAPTVGALQSFIEKAKLDILFVDQYSLLEDQRGARGRFDKMANISKDIKQLQVKTGIPIIAASQMNRTKNEDQDKGIVGADTTRIAESDRIVQDATSVLMIEQKKDKETNNFLLTINIIKSRDGGVGRILQYQADFSTGYLHYIPSDEDGISTKEDFNNIASAYELSEDNVF